MKIKFPEKKRVPFEDIEVGQTFFVNGFCSCWIKILEVHFPYDGEEIFNAVCLADGGLCNFNEVSVTPVEIEAEARFTEP